MDAKASKGKGERAGLFPARSIHLWPALDVVSICRRTIGKRGPPLSATHISKLATTGQACPRDRAIRKAAAKTAA